MSISDTYKSVLYASDGITPIVTTRGIKLVPDILELRSATDFIGALNADVIPSTDVSLYAWLSLQIVGTWVGTISFQISNDNVNWLSTPLLTASSGLGTVASTTASNGVFHGPRTGKYFRARLTAHSSGTPIGILESFTLPSVLTTIGSVVGGSTAAGGVDSGQPVKIGGKYNTTPPTLTDGWRGDTQLDNVGNTRFVAQAGISGGATAYRNLDLGVTGQIVKASVGQLYGWHFSNAAITARFVKVYNKATAPTEADTPVMTLYLPASNAIYNNPLAGILFSNGISLRATTAIADADTGAPTANDVIANLWYK